MSGICLKDLKERAWDSVEERTRRAGYRTNAQEREAQEDEYFPDLVENLSPAGWTIYLEPGQPWIKEFDYLQKAFLETDKNNVRYIGMFWCSHTRALTVFDCRNYQGGLYAFSDFAKRS